MNVDASTLDELLGECKSPADVASLYSQLLQRMLNRGLDAFEAEWGSKYRAAIRVWRTAWANVIPLFQFPPKIRKITYTTNAIESLNASKRKYTRNRRIFPNDDSEMKSLYLAIRKVSQRWKTIHNWKPALQVFQILFGEDRVPVRA